MNIEKYLIMMFLSIALYLIFIWVNFADLERSLFKSVPLKKMQGEYDEMKKIRNSSQFKTHRRKWIRIYLLLVVIYVIDYIAIAVFTKSSSGAFLIAFLLSIFNFGLANDIEGRQRRSIGEQGD